MDETPESSPLKKAKSTKDEGWETVSEESADVQGDAMDADEPSSGKKAVHWGSKLKVRKFFKKKPICAPDEAQSSPTFNGTLKSVLKPTKSPIQLTKKFKKGHKRAKSIDFI